MTIYRAAVAFMNGTQWQCWELTKELRDAWLARMAVQFARNLYTTDERVTVYSWDEELR